MKQPSYRRGLGPEEGGACGGRDEVVWVRLVCGVSGERPGGDERRAQVGPTWDHGSPGERDEIPGYTYGCYTGDGDDGYLLVRSCGSFQRHGALIADDNLTSTPLCDRFPLSQKMTTCRFANHRIYATHIRLKK